MTISVVIPTRNRADSVVETVRAVRDTAPSGTELIVVDNGSTDGTALRVTELADRVVRHERPSAAAARNAGAAAAGGDVLVFVDDDVRPAAGAIAAIVAAVLEKGRVFVVARLDAPAEVEASPLHRWREARMPFEPEEDLTSIEWFQSGFAAVDAEAFRSLGGYSEEFPGAGLEDIDLALRAADAGIRILFARNVAAVHDDYAGKDIFAAWRRTRSNARTAVTMARLHPEHAARQMVERNAPISRADGVAGAKKALRIALGSDLVATPLLHLIRQAERLPAASRLLPPLYTAALTGATNRGVRDGLRLDRPDTGR